MAELVLSAFLPVLFDRLASAAVKTITRYKGIETEIKKWQRSLTQIQDVLTDASQKEITNQSVKRWLNDLQHLAYDIDDVLDDLAYQEMEREFNHEPSKPITSKVRKIIPRCCTNFSTSNKMHEQLDIISAKLQDLVKERTDLGLRVEEETRPTNITNNRRFQSSVVDPSSIVGRKKEKQELVQQLLSPSDQNYSIVPIFGMGGVGKTTLAGLLYNEKQVKDHFQLKAWVCVSDEFDIFSITKVIFKSVAPEVKEEFTDFNLLQVALANHLRGKTFLLVLDDVWSEDYDDWKNLVKPFYTCTHGSKIIITTRKDELLKQLVYSPLNKQLDTLSDEDALSLVAINALDANTFDSHLSLKPYAEGIVKKCGGLPLALIALGRLLRTKKDEVEHWEDVLNSEIWSLKDGGGIIPALRLSYNDLLAPLKQLFAYCSLFPKDFLFNKQELVLLWMAEGFLHQSTPSHSTKERLGHEYFDELLSRSFFQHAPNSESMFVMHDLLNDLAIYVAGEFFVRLDNETEKNTREEMFRKYRHMSFVCEQYVAYKRFNTLRRTKCLRTFLATSVGVVESWQPFYLSNKVLTDLLPELPFLRVLHLRNSKISEVPKSIGTLRHLRYLNLSNTIITHLPEDVCKLYNLQTLIVYGCYCLVKLPNNFLKLKNLVHLDIRVTPLLHQMPLGIGELKSLQTLSKIVIGGESGIEIAKLKEFKNLCGKISIIGLEKVLNVTHADDADFSQKRLSELELVWSDEPYGSRNEVLEKEVLTKLKPCNDKLYQLKIRSYGGLEFPNWVEDPSFVHLKQVSISGCKKCTSLPSFGQLPSLKKLSIKGLDGVKVVGMELLGTGHAFPSLESLRFKKMQKWEKWLTSCGVVFLSLKELIIKDCPILVEVTLESLPSLNVLKINGCHNLVEVTLESLPSLNVLKIDGCNSDALRRLIQVASALTKLSIYNILGLDDAAWGGVIQYLGAVEEIKIGRCNELIYLWDSNAAVSKVLLKLRNVEVFGCHNLVSLGEKEEGGHCSFPDSIETLAIRFCTSFRDLPSASQKLKSFSIENCDKLLGREWGGQNRSRMIEHVNISGWANLKSIIELKYLVHLTKLSIHDCESLELFPYIELSTLTSLKSLEITKCPSMDACFPGGVWPPNLHSLWIGKLNKSILEWGPQNFPTTLVNLRLFGGEDGVSSCSQFSHFLPSSLISLEIIDFQKLESFSMGLQHLQCLSFDNCHNLNKVSHPQHQHQHQHLTSLQHLSFSNCPNMMDLPETLLPSLLGLHIWCCPNLEQRCSEKGCYWPLISHIPFIAHLIYPG
ncbi:hypothetical protein QVD17_28050 [Tagetes erecta]|uniref:Uncharacterized protein n=1 Tax=Tagetes erecta TaxID=13708 RepID=A0AAD8K9P5_TARER|nr:hypothetical protein QVD17_28050 [Tagetes erecta]